MCTFFVSLSFFPGSHLLGTDIAYLTGIASCFPRLGTQARRELQIENHAPYQPFKDKSRENPKNEEKERRGKEIKRFKKENKEINKFKKYKHFKEN